MNFQRLPLLCIYISDILGMLLSVYEHEHWIACFLVVVYNIIPPSAIRWVQSIAFPREYCDFYHKNVPDSLELVHWLKIKACKLGIVTVIDVEIFE